jgi:ornithine cyclodeaminase/alanine dehydrogenase
MPLWLTKDDVEHVLTMPAAIDAVETAYRLLAEGKAVLPLRINMGLPSGTDSLLAMPAYLGGTVNTMGVKLVTLFADNPKQRGLPAIQGTFALFDATNGRLLAVMDAAAMTAVRTGAASGVATKYLARPDARVVTIFGAGVQAESQLEAIAVVRPIEQVWVVARMESSAERFAHAMTRRLNIPVQAASTVQAAVEAADIIVTATSAHEPVFSGDWLRPGVHINSIGAHTPDARELDDATIRRAKIVTDLKSACLAETGDLIQPIERGLLRPEQIHGDMGEVILGRKPGRESQEEITLFKSVGLAVQDVATAAEIYQQALSQSVGRVLAD